MIKQFKRNMTSGVLRPALFVVCVSALTSNASAQTAQLNMAQMARDQVITAPTATTPTTSADQTHVVTSPNDADLGEQQILKRTEGYQPFYASVSVPFYWTSNVALTNTHEVSDFLVSPVVALGYQPHITENLFANIGVREQLFYYDRLTSFNFGSFDIDLGLTYTIPQAHNLILHAGYDYNRLTKKNSFDDFFNNHMFVLSAEMPFTINRAQQFSIGVDTYISMGGDPQGPRRHDFDGWIGYSVQATRALVLSASFRLGVHDYVQTDRADLTEMVALNANYTINRYLSAGFLTSFAANQSNHSVFDYEVGNVGGVASFTIRF